jgi:hypothetical protein
MASQAVSRRSPLILEIDISERLFVVIAHDKARGLFLDGQRRREAACGHYSAILTNA